MSPACEGLVTEFDEATGLGVAEAGERRYGFHCTRIADGTRTIPVGTRVRFVVVPGRAGEWEASELRAIGTGSAAG